MNDGCKYFRSCTEPPCPMKHCVEEYKNVATFRREIRQFVAKKLYKEIGLTLTSLSYLFDVDSETVRKWVNK